MELSEKVAIVTGAGRGIGRGIAQRLAAEGVRVVLASRTQKTVDAVANDIRANGGECLAAQCDVTDQGQVERTISECVDRFGRLDILVNNAQSFGSADLPTATPVPKPLETFPFDEWQHTLTSGLSATLWAMQAAFPHLRESREAAIVNFASGNGYKGIAGTAAYNATKEAIRGLSRTAATEWGQYGITVNVIVPVIETDAMRAFFEELPAGSYEATVEQIPMRRYGDARLDAGGLVAFLGGPDARYFTGKSFELDGGLEMKP